MASTKKAITSSSSTTSLSYSTPAAAGQEDMRSSRRTTRSMKAKAAQEAALIEEHANIDTSNAVSTLQLTNNSATVPVSTSREQASIPMELKSDSDDARNTAHTSRTTISTMDVSPGFDPVKGEISTARVSRPQQNQTIDQTMLKGDKAVKSHKQTDGRISDAFHLMTKHFPDGKILVNSNGKPRNFQAGIDADLGQWISKERVKPPLWGTQIEPVSAQDMLNDFRDMGFSSSRIDDMVSKREPLLVDGCAQRPSAGFGKHVEGTGPAPEKRRRKSSGRGKSTYEALVVFEGQKWVLFDPLRGYPVEHGQPPAFVTKWETYQPGNSRVLLQHPTTRSIVLRTSPQALQDRTVDYTEYGPKIRGWERIANSQEKTPSRPPEPKPEPEPEPARPTLGRGTRRTTTTTTPFEASNPSPASVTPKPPQPAVPKRKSFETSKAETPTTSPTQKDKAEDPSPATKKVKTEPGTLTPCTTLPPTAGEPSIAAESLVGKGKQKRKRRAGRPKKSAARVENSSSE